MHVTIQPIPSLISFAKQMFSLAFRADAAAAVPPHPLKLFTAAASTAETPLFALQTWDGD